MRHVLATAALAATAATLLAAPVPQQIPQPQLADSSRRLNPRPKPPEPEPLPSDIIWAEMVLSCPPGTPEMTPPDDLWAERSRALLHVCRRDQLINRYEEWYFGRHAQKDFQEHLDKFRARRSDMKDYPRAEEAHGFPDQDTCRRLLAFNAAFLAHLETRLLWEQDRADVIGPAIEETKELQRVWRMCLYAHHYTHAVVDQREYLNTLRKWLTENLGRDAFIERRMPDYVPIWRFVEVGRDGHPVSRR